MDTVNITKEKTGIPSGDTVTKKTVNTTVEEIEKGFLISKNYDVNWEIKGDKEETSGGMVSDKESCHTRTGYAYYTKKWFTKDNPLSFKTDDKSLADAFKTD